MHASVLDPAVLALEDRSTPDLEIEVISLASQVAALTARFLAVVRELDRREVWATQGCRSMAHYLSWKAAMSLRTAQDHVRVAHALAELPVTRAAFEEGRISYSKARAITRMATPETDADLLGVAVNATAAMLDRIASGYVRATSEDDRGSSERQQSQRSAWWAYNSSGGETLTIILPADEAAVVRKALKRASEWVAEPDQQAPALQRLASTVVALAERVLEHELQVNEAEPVAARVVVHADVEVLQGKPGTCTTDDGKRLAPDTLRRLCCDAEIQLAVEDANGELIRFGRAKRVINRAMRRQLMRAQQHCQWPGCHERHHLQGHHVVAWIDGGATDPENIRLLCRFHHRFVHEGGCELRVLSDCKLEVRHPRGWILASHHPVVINRDPGRTDRMVTLDNRWDGSQLDLASCVGAICDLQQYRRKQAARQPVAA